MIHKTTRSILSVLLAALLLVTSIPLTPAFAGDGGAVSLQSESAESEGLKQDGDGTYLIYTAENLKEFAKLVNGGKTDASAVLTDDIDLNPGFTFKEDGRYSGPDGEEPHQWTPIGTSSSRYTGTFDGNGHKIENLYINDSGADNQGLFGYLRTSGDNKGTVKNLSVSGTVIGRMFVGGVVGDNRGNVINCAFSGSVSGDSSVGGVVGYNGGTVENCYKTGTVTGTNDWVGGVVGSNSFSATVTNCYNTGNISGDRYVGGVVGDNSSIVVDNSSNVENCYNIGEVSGNSYVGGVVGSNTFGATVTNCYNTGTVSDGTTSGGVVGQNSGSVTNCYFLKQNGVPANGIGGGETTGATAVDDLNDQKQFEGWDFIDIWRISQSLGFPVLQDNAQDGLPPGLGTEASPYEISTADELKNFATAVNDGSEKSAHAKLMNDINLNGNTTNQWIPIGNSIGNSYGGTFNGDGHTISGLYIGSSDSYQGLFGYVGTRGTVQNLSVSGSVNVTGNDGRVGGVVGWNSGNVTNCYNTGGVKVTGNYGRVGGVVGWNSGNVTNCYNTGGVKVTGNYGRVGGVVGDNGGSVKNCYNTGSGNSVGGNSVGGICGQNDGGTITNCYWRTDTANKGVGGGDGTVTNVEGKTAEQYASGEVAWLLNREQNEEQTESPWGQGSNDMPVLISNCPEGVTIKTPVRITIEMQNDETTEQYGYTTAGSTLASYPNNYIFFEDDQYSTIIDKATKTFDKDTTIYAQTASTVTSIALNKNTLALYVNDTEQLTATVAPEGANGTILWTSSAPTVATVDGNGSVHAVGAGTATITAAAASDSSKNAACTVTVTESVYGITADTTALDFGSVYTGYAQPAAQTVTLTNTGNQRVTLVQPTAENFEIGKLSETTLEPDETATFTIQPKDKLPRGSYSEQITISGNDGASATLTASFTVKEPPYTGKYSYEISTDIGDNGAISVDRYATEGEKVTIDVTPDQAYKLDELVVTANGKDVELTANSDGTYTFTMPSADVKITATFAEDPDWTEPEEPATDVSDIFLDIAPDAWYKDAVQYAYDNGLMTGTSANEFAPEQTTTRAMIVSILARLEGVTTAQAAGFADVDDNDWYATAVNWAASVGVVNGYEDNTFQPNTAITREQLAAILMNYAAYKGEDVSNRADLDNYTDQPSTWAEEAMSWAVAEGLISGVTNDQLQPQGNATRAQVAAILQRFLEA